MLQSGDFHFSFSGLKTSALHALKRNGGALSEEMLPDFCASFQEAIVEVLTTKLFEAARACGVELVTVSGGVSCNRRLRDKVAEASSEAGIEALAAKPIYSTDNAAMIAFAAASRRKAGVEPSPLNRDIDPNLRLG
jgi:N6-L-threonylcarbamoyladenine synthase